MNLVIELKPHGAEPSNYIDILIDEVKRLKLENYKFMSLNSKVMEELETKSTKLGNRLCYSSSIRKFSS